MQEEMKKTQKMQEKQQKKETQVVTHRTYKDRLFRMIFEEKKELLSLYNAVNHTQYTNPDDLEVNTLENAVYLNMKNDLSFVIHTELSLYEHQSSYNPNLPLRDLIYVAKVYQSMAQVQDWNLYGSTLVKIPTPRFITFYNGVEKQPERQILKLSDAFEEYQSVRDEGLQSVQLAAQDERLENGESKTDELELKVLMLNINPGFNKELMKNCKTLRDYMTYVDKVRTYEKCMKLDEAVEKAISECMAEGILADFLGKYRAEAKDVSIFEYDEEKHMEQERREWERKGRQEERRILIEKMFARGIGVPEIAELLEEDIKVIEEIVWEIKHSSK